MHLPPVTGLILKVAGACNLNCGYCYVYNAKDQTHRSRPGLLSDELLDRVLTRAVDYCQARPGHRLAICLHGGEPLLLGKARFAEVVTRIRERLGPHLASLAVQTNGVLIDPAWADLLQSLRLSVSLSLDGDAAVNDAGRPDHMGRGTYAAASQGLLRLLAAGVRVSVLCVVRPGASGAAVYRHLRSLGVRSLDFLLPDISHDDYGDVFGDQGLLPAADYLIPAIDAWLQEDDASVDVRFFTDVLRLALGDEADTDAFGGGPSSYLVIETDGAIQANDALRVCEEGLGETGLNVLTHGFDDLHLARALPLQVFAGALQTPGGCAGCQEEATCAGGYLPHRYSRARGFDNPSVWCADIQAIFSHARAVLAADAAAQRP
jgi:uncharacterized protein